MNARVFNAKILQVSASDFVKDSVVSRGLHLAQGDDVFVDCLDIQEKGFKADDSEFGQIFSKAIEEGCHYIHLF